MWRIKVFKTRFAMQVFIDSHKIEWHEVFINNSYGIEYRFLRKINV